VGLDKLSNAFGYEIDWSASSSIGKAYESGKSTSEIFKAIVDGIIDSWSKAIEHTENGDYSQLMDLGAELALDIAIVTAGAATPGVAAKRVGTAARLAKRALVLSEDAGEALTRRMEALLQRTKQALKRVPEEARAALLDAIDTASGWLTGLKESVKIADAGVGTMRVVEKSAITQAIQRSRGARAISRQTEQSTGSPGRRHLPTGQDGRDRRPFPRSEHSPPGGADRPPQGTAALHRSHCRRLRTQAR
jgi:hypothetical protein